MNFKQDSISELKEKLARTINEINDGKRTAYKLKNLLAKFFKKERNNLPSDTSEPLEGNEAEMFDESESPLREKKGTRYAGYDIAEDDEELKIVSPIKNNKQNLENERNLKDFVGQ